MNKSARRVTTPGGLRQTINYLKQYMKIQQNGWEPERAKLKAELVKLKAELTMVNHVKAISV